MSEVELQRLWGAFDLDVPFGRSDRALFTVMLETGLHLWDALVLRWGDLYQEEQEAQDFTRPGWEAAG